MATIGLVSGRFGDGNNRQRDNLQVLLGALLASVVVHAVSIALVKTFPLSRQEHAPRQVVVNVEIVAPPSRVARQSPATSSREVEKPLAGTPGTIRPRTMLAAGVLADPHSAKARATLPQLAAPERAEQLCNVEAMAQISAWNDRYRPDLIIAYAMGETAMADGAVIAEGAAFHSVDAWYRLSYRCRPDVTKPGVLAFEFSVGPAIPKDEWEDHGLPADGGVEDDDDR